ncbi:MAG: class II aldolase/adducin family protein [Proteobacteria bacterium]|nr:class II aldolase/adducin family protein [Pseudomonadota bacterium]
MTVAIAPKPPHVPRDMTDGEWQARINLAACYRLVARNRWDDLLYTHISAAVPGPQKHFLINPYGMLFSEINASSLVKVDLDGNIVGDSAYSINPAGFIIHSAVHAAREDVACVLHLHTIAGVAVSAQKRGLLPISQTALFIYNDVSYHDYEGIALDPDERARLVAHLGQKNRMILRNHGTLACGDTVAEAYMRMYFLERACQMQIAAQSGGAELNMLPQSMSDRVFEQLATGYSGIGEANWAPLLRLLDREDPSYRE